MRMQAYKQGKSKRSHSKPQKEKSIEKKQYFHILSAVFSSISFFS